MKIHLTLLLLLVSLFSWAQTQIGQVVYGQPDEGFGLNVELSEDGNIMAISCVRFVAYDKPSHVSIFKLENNVWNQIGSDISAPDEYLENFSEYIAMDNSGDRIVIASPDEDKCYTYDFVDSEWQMNAEVNNQGDMAISGDGNTLVTSYNGMLTYSRWNNNSWQTVDSIAGGGFMEVSSDGNTIVTSYHYPGGQQLGVAKTYFFESDTLRLSDQVLYGAHEKDFFGFACTLNESGDRLAIGSAWYITNMWPRGAFDIYTLENGEWHQSGDKILGSNFDLLGYDLDFDGPGERLAVSSPSPSGYAHVEIYSDLQDGWERTFRYEDQSIWNYGQSVALADDPLRFAGTTTGISDVNSRTGAVKVIEFLPTGILEISEIGLNVFPNPSKPGDFINWNQLNEEVHVRLLDCSGQILHTVKTRQNGFNIPNNLQSGFYFLNLRAAEKNYIEKILIE